MCEEWVKYFSNLDDNLKSIYEPPEEYNLPIEVSKHTFWYQFMYQTKRIFLVSWRNRLSKIINFSIIVGSVVFITALDGITEVSVDADPNLPFDTFTRPQITDRSDIFRELFAHSLSPQLQ